MDYESMDGKIRFFFSFLKIEEDKKEMLIKAYLKPGMTKSDVINSKKNQNNLMKDLLKEGLIFFKKENDKEQIYPIPLILLMLKQKNSPNEEERKLTMDIMKGIDKWIKYPFHMNKRCKMRRSESNELIIKWIFDLLMADWERVYCFGDYESFIKTIGIDKEIEWIKERTKKGKKASVLATKDGMWAQRIDSLKQQELRKCKIIPQSFLNLFILAFPDINTTVISSVDGEVTFVHSYEFAKQYSQLVSTAL